MLNWGKSLSKKSWDQPKKTHSKYHNTDHWLVVVLSTKDYCVLIGPSRRILRHSSSTGRVWCCDYNNKRQQQRENRQRIASPRENTLHSNLFTSIAEWKTWPSLLALLNAQLYWSILLHNRQQRGLAVLDRKLENSKVQKFKRSKKNLVVLSRQRRSRQRRYGQKKISFQRWSR